MLPGEVAGAIALRPTRGDDEAFLRELFRASREEMLARVAWTEAQKAGFCRSQYEARDLHYRNFFPGARHSIVELARERVGAMIVARTAATLYLVDVCIAPAFQGRGIGTQLLLGLQEEARSLGVPLTLHVDSESRARRLYARHGFAALGDDGVTCEMEWAAGTRL